MIAYEKQPRRVLGLLAGAVTIQLCAAADLTPAPQRFLQEVANTVLEKDGIPAGKIQLVECLSGGIVRAYVAGTWYELHDQRWQANPSTTARSEGQFIFIDESGQPISVPVPWQSVQQLVRFGSTNYLVTDGSLLAVVNGKSVSLNSTGRVNQIALSREGIIHVASNDGLFQQRQQDWERVQTVDDGGRAWAFKDVLGIVFDSKNHLWFATRAGVGRRTAEGWKFYEGKDGLPWNDFTGMAAGPNGEVWFGTRLGAIRFDAQGWHYRQGPGWLPNDEVNQIAVDWQGTAWLATAGGLGRIEQRPMTLAEKAQFYEQEIERYIKRTPFGFVAQAALRKRADKSSAEPPDTDNDGLWTAMYGAGECFAYGATKDPKAKERAKQAFEALRFLQKVTQGCDHAPPKGYIARTIRPADSSDPNIGRIEGDRRERERDKLWKVYEPRWPKSADGKWFWKSDTSSDELDGHYFFYPLYFDLCADTEAERERVREVVRDVTDHLLTHDYVLIDHDGKPTRWAIYGPQFLNRDPHWWPERGLNSLSILSYLAVATHVTGDSKYEAASRQLIEQHHYAQNVMYPKVQQGASSGNQSDDEMAFMSYYSLLLCSKDSDLNAMVRHSFFRYWQNEAPEMNPFFNFAYAAHNLRVTGQSLWERFPLSPSKDWLEDSMATLYGFPLDRLNWSHRNSHRLDVIKLSVPARGYDDGYRGRGRGRCVNGKVVPVENRFFNHWNTDPWHLDYEGNGNELGAGTVFLLPYYMGLYHRFIERPVKQ